MANSLHNVPLSQLAEEAKLVPERELYAFLSLTASNLPDGVTPESDPYWSTVYREANLRASQRPVIKGAHNL